MKITIQTSFSENFSYWDTYVYKHPASNLYHLSKWQKVIKKSYGHKSFYLSASDNEKHPYPVRGILPLVHIKHFIFGNNLISMPYFDMGGILADDEKTEKALIHEAVNIAKNLKADSIELHHTAHCSLPTANCKTRSHKVRMLLKLPGSPEELMKSFKAKLRSQIKRPLKAGLYSKIGGAELLHDFYEVFAVNMRDLGSPVHSISLMRNIFEEFPGSAKIVMVYKDKIPIACSIIMGFKDTLQNPWASAVREYSRLSPNMLLYWTMLEYGCNHGYDYFDFGRSTPGEGTYKFKAQWGAVPETLHWQYIYLKNPPESEEVSENSKFDKAIQYWKKMPVSLSRLMGPEIRKYIGL